MAFDAFFLRAVLGEMQEAVGSRIEKIHQPTRDTVVLLLKTSTGRRKLLFVISPTAPRLHFTEQTMENPAQPPMFCMLLRKHLSGGRLTKIEQLPMERWAKFTFDCIDEMGDPTEKSLIAELMGRTCNLYLVDKEGRILDCLRRVGLDTVSGRAALPGLYYQHPAPMEKEDPATLTEADYLRILQRPGADRLCDRLMDSLGGLSPLVCREAALYALGETDARLEAADLEATAKKVHAFFEKYILDPIPCVYEAPDGTPKQYAFCPVTQYGEYREKESFCALLDSFYSQKDKKEAMAQKSQAVRKTVQNLCQRLQRKLAIQEKELEETYDRERLRQLGDILTANIHKMQKGMTKVQVEDFYDENMSTIEVAISPLLSPQQNAAKYYKDYSKRKNAEKELTRQIEIGEMELQYLQSVLHELSRAESDRELDEIRQELQDGGYIRADSGKKQMKKGKLPPLKFESTDGYTIYVGRNNQQNEELTFRMARKDDLWLHAQKVHGSHVIIACGGTTPPDDTVTQAAQLAAHYAETAGGQNIPVDVNPVGKIKRIPGGKPGMVIYHSHRTVVVNPYPDIVVDALNAEKKDV